MTHISRLSNHPPPPHPHPHTKLEIHTSFHWQELPSSIWQGGGDGQPVFRGQLTALYDALLTYWRMMERGTSGEEGWPLDNHLGGRGWKMLVFCWKGGQGVDEVWLSLCELTLKFKVFIFSFSTGFTRCVVFGYGEFRYHSSHSGINV